MSLKCQKKFHIKNPLGTDELNITKKIIHDLPNTHSKLHFCA